MRSLLHPDLVRTLAATASTWRSRRFWKEFAVLAIAACTAVLLLGVAMVRGWIQTPGAAALGFLLVVGLAGMAFLVLLVRAATADRPRAWLAQAVEQSHAGFLDRLNTLVFLEPRRHDPAVAPYARRIEEQAREELVWVEPREVFPRRTVRILWLAFVALAWGTFFFYQRTAPFSQLRAPEIAAAVAAAGEDTELPLPDAPGDSAVEMAGQEPAWGEVRITEPGRDLQVTKVDVVPLQIEAASSRPLKGAAWLTAVGGKKPETHALPAPAERNYAVYKPVLYVDELRLADWDVLAYHATASTRGGLSYASEVYFLEVRPFREDLLKLPGGEGGKAFRSLNELTGLIDRQKHVLRETHRFLARSYDRPGERKEDAGKLAGAEDELREAARHLYAKIAAEMENQNVGEVLDHLAQAEAALDRAARALRADDPSSRQHEQEALTHLIATRKSFQKAVSEGQGDGEGGEGDEPEPPYTDLPGKLKQTSELRDSQKVARENLIRAYKLREALDRQADRLEKMSEKPGDFSRQQAGQTADAARETARELKELVDQKESAGLFGPSLEEALSPEKQRSLEGKLDAVAGAEEAAERGPAAAAGAEALEKLGQAFDQSAPPAVRDLRKKDSLGGSRGEDALDRALRHLASLLPQGPGGTPHGPAAEVAPEDAERLKREALDDLRHGLQTREGKDRRVDNLLLEAEKAVKPGEEVPVDAARLQKLIDAIERFRVEIAGIPGTEDDLARTRVDPARLPASYRERIQRYFQKLSER